MFGRKLGRIGLGQALGDLLGIVQPQRSLPDWPSVATGPGQELDASGEFTESQAAVAQPEGTALIPRRLSSRSVALRPSNTQEL